MRQDRSKRTRVVLTCNIVFVIAIAAAMASAVWWGLSIARYHDMLDRSSSPIGTTLSFGRSNATMRIANFYTDQSRSALIVRFSIDDQSKLNLPTKGSDFSVFLSSKSLDHYEGQYVDALFGFYDQTGNLFLIIPKPTDDVYTVFIMNTKFVNTDSLAQTTDQSAQTQTVGEFSSDADAAAFIRDQLSHNDYTYIRDHSSGTGYAVQSNLADIVGFRITLKPAIESAAYVPTVLPGQLLSDDGTFDYEGFFDDIFRQNLLTQTRNEYADLSSSLEPLNERINELETRLAANPDDSAAQQRIEELRKQVSDARLRMVELAKSYDSLMSLTFSESAFQDMQTRAMVISSGDTRAVGYYASGVS